MIRFECTISFHLVFGFASSFRLSFSTARCLPCFSSYYYFPFYILLSSFLFYLCCSYLVKSKLVALGDGVAGDLGLIRVDDQGLHVLGVRELDRASWL